MTIDNPDFDSLPADSKITLLQAALSDYESALFDQEERLASQSTRIAELEERAAAADKVTPNGSEKGEVEEWRVKADDLARELNASREGITRLHSKLTATEADNDALKRSIAFRDIAYAKMEAKVSNMLCGLQEFKEYMKKVVQP